VHLKANLHSQSAAHSDSKLQPPIAESSVSVSTSAQPCMQSTATSRAFFGRAPAQQRVLDYTIEHSDGPHSVHAVDSIPNLNPRSGSHVIVIGIVSVTYLWSEQLVNAEVLGKRLRVWAALSIF
jgi:hypothetical protein